MAKPRNILLAVLRNDLRLHDHPIFSACAEPTPPSAAFDREVTHVLPVYVLDQAQIEVGGLPELQKGAKGGEAKTRVAGFWRCGEPRVR